MDPRKEANYILARFIQEWIAYFNVDGWIFMVRFDRDLGEFGAWELCAAHPDPLHNKSYSVGVRAFITREEWEEHPITILVNRVERMHAESFLRENQAPAGDVAFRAGRRRPWWEEFIPR